jgi:hypothetical protein
LKEERIGEAVEHTIDEVLEKLDVVMKKQDQVLEALGWIDSRAFLNEVAIIAANSLSTHLSKLNASFSFEDDFSREGDTVQVSFDDGCQKLVQIHRIKQEKIINDAMAIIKSGSLASVICPLMSDLAKYFKSCVESAGAKQVVFTSSNMHLPMPMTGAIGACHMAHGAMLRTLFVFDPTTLCQVFIFDMLVGHAIKEK